MNDIVIQNGVVIPVLWRNGVAAAAPTPAGHGPHRLGLHLWRLPYWYKA